MKTKKLAFYKMIPNMITLTAMAAGMTSIKFAIVGNWEMAATAIIVAAFMDAFDGAAARLLKAQSKLGAELDSLSDFVCFGAAPAIVTFLWTTNQAGRFGWIVSLIFAMAVALRLARFNIAKDEEVADNPLNKYFTGIPSPAGALLALLPMIISFQLDPTDNADTYMRVAAPSFVCFWLLVLAAMLVSHIPTFSTKQLRIPQKMTVPALGVFAIIIAGVINETWPTLTLLGIAYLLLLPLGVRHYNRKKASLAQGVQDPDDAPDGDED